MTGPASSTPARARASMSYLRFWPTFSIVGSLQDRPEGGERRGAIEHVASPRPAHRRGNRPRPPSNRTTARPARPAAGPARWSRCRRRTWAAGAALPGTSRTTPGCRPAGIRPPRVGRARPVSLRRRGRSQLVAETVEPALGADRQQGLAVWRLGLQRVPVEIAAADRRAGLTRLRASRAVSA